MYTLLCTSLCTETLYEKDGMNSTTMQARQSTQPTRSHQKQKEQFDSVPVNLPVNIPVATKKKPGGTKDANVPSRCEIS